MQQEYCGNLMSLCSAGDCGHLWTEKLILSSEIKCYGTNNVAGVGLETLRAGRLAILASKGSF